MVKCLICKKSGKTHTHPTSLCLMLHGASGKGGRIGASRVPKEYQSVTVDDLTFNQPMFKAYCESFKREQDGTTATRIKSLYLWSAETGTGKTTSASAVLNEFHLTHVIKAWKSGLKPNDYPTFFLDLNEVQELYNRSNRPNVAQEVAQEASREYYRRLDLAKASQMVAIDDVGVRSATEAFRGDLHTVINHRVTQQLPTIYTSNLPLASMVDVYDKRLYDRMRDLTVTIEFTGESKRGLR